MDSPRPLPTGWKGNRAWPEPSHPDVLSHRARSLLDGVLAPSPMASPLLLSWRRYCLSRRGLACKACGRTERVVGVQSPGPCASVCLAPGVLLTPMLALCLQWWET